VGDELGVGVGVGMGVGRGQTGSGSGLESRLHQDVAGGQ
jgi:hypothetical protein